ncbi:hypothetical protein HD554DRAFT_1307520 [Boletus coccyginus]|nr:hypothetical protein HD554DRAFT_1307520 [Boletus coccyginus]
MCINIQFIPKFYSQCLSSTTVDIRSSVSSTRLQAWIKRTSRSLTSFNMGRDRSLDAQMPKSTTIRFWYIKNKYHEPTSNEVTIESAKIPGIYAYADPVDGAPVLGQPGNPTIWTLVARGDGKYNIQSPNNNLLWELKNPNDYIKLGDYGVGTQPYNEWRFQPI